ncbi:MAG TPA: hypothetical protein PLV82_03730 [bacterium]|nr:hypothetical protein [bacterium]
MKAQELNLTGSYGLTVYPSGSHCSVAMWNSFFMPNTKTQVLRFFKATDGWINSQVIYSQGQANEVDAFMLKHGYEANFKFTKSKTMCRLVNFEDFKNAVRKEFNLKTR